MVFEGKVEVFDPVKQSASQPPKTTLTEGDAIPVGRLAQAAADQNDLARPRCPIVRQRSQFRIVADVSDNVVQDDFHRYYACCATAWARERGCIPPGIPAPGTRRPCFISSGAFGADVICTFSADRRETDLEITLTINRPCELYVLPDTRAPVPEWLQRDFVDTGLRLRSGPWTPRGTSPTRKWKCGREDLRPTCSLEEADRNARAGGVGSAPRGTTKGRPGDVWNRSEGTSVITYTQAMKTVCLLLVSACLTAASAEERYCRPAAAQHPWLAGENIELDLGCYGEKLVRTPNLDRLAAEGIRYTRVFSTNPACAPSRSAFFTGMYQTSTDTHPMRSHRDDAFRLPPAFGRSPTGCAMRAISLPISRPSATATSVPASST